MVIVLSILTNKVHLAQFTQSLWGNLFISKREKNILLKLRQRGKMEVSHMHPSCDGKQDCLEGDALLWHFFGKELPAVPTTSAAHRTWLETAPLQLK